MHSRIFVFAETPDTEDYITADGIIDSNIDLWYDYVDDKTDLEDDAKWLKNFIPVFDAETKTLDIPAFMEWYENEYINEVIKRIEKELSTIKTKGREASIESRLFEIADTAEPKIDFYFYKGTEPIGNINGLYSLCKILQRDYNMDKIYLVNSIDYHF